MSYFEKSFFFQLCLLFCSLNILSDRLIIKFCFLKKLKNKKDDDFAISTKKVILFYETDKFKDK